MKKLHLHYSHLLQGDFKLQKLNLLLVFQVNCPGCFSYALPFFNKLYAEFKNKEISFLALSTAFEDFDKNTFENTKALVENGILVGETKKMMLKEDEGKLPYTLDFPIAMDALEDELQEQDFNNAAVKICILNPNYNLWPVFEKETLQKRVVAYLKSLDKIALTFTLNQFKGTPSFVLFNDNHEILEEYFGHISYEQLASKINNFI